MTRSSDPEATRIDDAGLVRAPRWLVHRRLADLDAWPSWWPGMHRLGRRRDGDHWLHHVEVAASGPWRPRRALRLSVLAHGHRPDVGLRLLVAGDVCADVEFWLEDVGQGGSGGTLVHHLATVTGPTARSATRWRAVVRRGTWALADRLAAEVRRAVLVEPAAAASAPSRAGPDPGRAGP
ncbi:hypothetical protein [Salsipaludibacter albus]|uniref:hypothetical protein n=1 Tax=Salsipaludibacter albus TaxID=2849650 RepID=UPI001EE3C919|nr:hypothetical protein [Salsipaludibacter albus]MBY5164293.1 hypothetical protein [Salsipaludibacter albus]